MTGPAVMLNLAQRHVVPDVRRQGNVRARVIQHPLINHLFRAVQPLFAGLKDQLDGADQLVCR